MQTKDTKVSTQGQKKKIKEIEETNQQEQKAWKTMEDNKSG